MASEFLKLKWKKLFHTHDINGDNMVTIEDADIFSGNMAKYHNLKPDEAAEATRKARIYWKEFIIGDQEGMDEDTFVANKEREYLENPTEFKEKARRLFTHIIEVIDVNKDMKISEKEFEIMAKSTGFKNYNKTYMDHYPQVKPGYISLDEYLQCYLEFISNPDSSKIGREKPRLYGMGVIDENGQFKGPHSK